MAESGVIFIAPVSAPIHGQCIASRAMRRALEDAGPTLAVYDTSEGVGSSLGKLARKLVRSLRAFVALLMRPSRDTAYISANSGVGAWITVALAAAARMRSRTLAIHYHSFQLVTSKSRRYNALVRIAGANSLHIMLGDDMVSRVTDRYAEIGHVASLNNAGLVETYPGASEPRIPVLGHMSNLTAEKGLNEVIDLAIELKARGCDFRLIIAGPTADRAATEAMNACAEQLGTSFSYLGPVYGSDKQIFFSDITHFIFPSRYKNEAAPLVLLEALSARKPVIAYDVGTIAEMLGPAGRVVPTEENFVDETIEWLHKLDTSHEAWAAQNRFEQLLKTHQASSRKIVNYLLAGPSALGEPE